MKLKKKQLLILGLSFCTISFVAPIVFFHCTESLFSSILLSFSAVQAIATIILLIIAILLYDRFGLESSFKIKQTEKVLELVDELKGRFFTAHATKEFTYFIHLGKGHLEGFETTSFYKEDRSKTILLSRNDFFSSFKKVFAIKRSYWLPESIKQKLDFLMFHGTYKIENPEEGSYILVDFGSDCEKEWVEPMPAIRFDEFNNHLINLINAIETWLDNNSQIKLNLKFEEESQFNNENIKE